MDVLKKYRLHIILFIVSILTTTIAGAEWMYGKFVVFPEPYRMDIDDFLGGFSFSIPFLLYLTVHELGHYLTARYYDIKVTLPYYIPVWLGFFAAPSIGTMGAFIKIEDKPKTTRQFFDVGIAGPLAGLVIAVFVMIYGLFTLPPKDYIFQIHPEYQIFGENYESIVYELDTAIYTGDLDYLSEEAKQQIGDTAYFATGGLELGSTLLYDFLLENIAPHPERVPNMKELYHYPWLFAGFLAFLFTALNLLPIGQLDGGHVLYGLLGYRRSNIAFKGIFVAFILFAGFGVIHPFMSVSDLALYGTLYMLYLNIVFRSISPNFKIRLLISIWVFIIQYIGVKFVDPVFENSYIYLVFGFVVGRFLGTAHPPSEVEMDLGWKRKVIGWLAILIFFISFSPSPFNISIGNDSPQEARDDFPGQMVDKSSTTESKNHYKAGGID